MKATIRELNGVSWDGTELCAMCRAVVLKDRRWVVWWTWTTLHRGRVGTLDPAEYKSSSSIDVKCCSQECAEAKAAEWVANDGPDWVVVKGSP